MDPPNTLVYDLTSTHISQTEKQVLQKGLNFVPVRPHHTDTTEIHDDYTAFRRRALLRLHFSHSSTQDIPPQDRLKNPSDWTPPPHSKPIAGYLHKLGKAYKTGIQTQRLSVPDNLTPNLRKALQQLRNKPHITIKPADKGGAVVTMDTHAYIQSCEDHLHSDSYRPFTDSDQPIREATKKCILELRNLNMIKENTASYCTENLFKPTEPRPFFGLPKIHKPQSKWKFGLPPMRPIVSDCPSSTYRAGQLLNTFMQPASTEHPSYLKDTQDFISKITNHPVSEHAILFTMDVESLYTNIPHEGGLEAAQDHLLNHYGEDKTEPLMKLLELQLKNNDFTFADKTYLQVKGCAMGKSWAPAYANMYMASWERKLVVVTQSMDIPFPTLWYRFLDDIIGTFEGSQEEWNSFLNIANSLDPNIRLTSETHEQQIPFLDLMVFKHQGQLHHSLYRKETDTMQYIRSESMHPQHTHKAVATSQFLRALRNCSRQEDRDLHTRIMSTAFKNRGFSKRTLRQAYKQAKTLFLQQHSDTPKPPPTPRDILTTTYNHHISNLPKQLSKEHQNLLSKWPNSGLDKSFPAPPLLAWRKSPSLKNILVRARTKQPNTNQTSTQP